MAILHKWTTSWRRDDTGELFCLDVTCRKYELDFKHHHDPLSRRLQACINTPPNSTMDVLKRLYTRKGYRFDPPQRRPQAMQPCAEPPDARYSVLYSMLACNGSVIERAVRDTIDPRFSIEELIQIYMRRYELPDYDLPIVFPTLRSEISNVKHERDVVRRGKLVKPRKQARKREAFYDRLIPLTQLPLVLDLLPEYFQCCNNIVHQCTQLKDALFRDKAFAQNGLAVRAQAFMLNHNCSVLCFWQQQARSHMRFRALVPFDSNDSYTQLLELFSLQRQQQNQHEALLFYCNLLLGEQEEAEKNGTTRQAAQRPGHYVPKRTGCGSG